MIMDDLDPQIKKAPVRNDGGQPLFGVTLLELRLINCRYVIGSDEDLGAIFCGSEVHRVSYCRAHYRLCYIKRKPVSP
jgi:hypothetical protein